MILPDRRTAEQRETAVSSFEETDELEGKLSFSGMDDKLMHAVLENDAETVETGNLIRESMNQGISSFTPSCMFETMVKNFSIAKKLFGETMIRAITGYDPEYIEKNTTVPEFQRELKKAVEEKVKQLQKKRVLDVDGRTTEQGIELAALVMAVEELDHLTAKGILGEKVNKKQAVFGFKEEYLDYRKGMKYKEIAVRRTVKTAIRRGHEKPLLEDVKVYDKEARGKYQIIYAIDASGSMKGKKIDASKRAGIALAYKGIQEKNQVGLIIFGEDIKTAIAPTQQFTLLLKEVVQIKAAKETNIALALRKANELFTDHDVSKHLLILTDGIPTAGDAPEEETIKAALLAREQGITISLIGITLDEKGKALAEKLVEIGEGRLYAVKDIEELDQLILEEYYRTTQANL